MKKTMGQSGWRTAWTARLKRVAAFFALTLTVCGLSACGGKEDEGGAKKFTVEVVDDQGESTSYESATDQEMLYDALLEIDGLTIDGYESDYGFYITAVNGLTADYEKDGAYWSIYVNGEYGSYGVESQPVTDGDSYRLVYEVYTAQ